MISVPYQENLHWHQALARCAVCGFIYHKDLHKHSFRGSKDILRHFPGFVEGKCALCGKHKDLQWDLFRRVEYALLGPGVRGMVRCPKCGSGETRVSYDHLFGKVLWWLVRGIRGFMPRHMRWRWMLVLLSRNPEVQTGRSGGS